MNKRTKILLATSIPTTLISTLSIPLALNFYKTTNKQQTSIKTSSQTQTAFNEQEVVSELLNDVFENDEFKIQSYVFNQNLIADEKIDELKLSLSYFNTQISEISTKIGALAASIANYTTVRTSGESVFYNMTSNWYWILKNIDKFDFKFYPYELNRYRGHPLEEGELKGYKRDRSYFIKEPFLYYATRDENNNVTFNFDDLPEGFNYEIESLRLSKYKNITIKTEDVIHYNDRQIHKIYKFDEHKNLILTLNLGDNYKNKEVLLDVLETKKNTTTTIKTNVGDDGNISVNLNQLPNGFYKITSIYEPNLEVYDINNKTSLQPITLNQKNEIYSDDRLRVLHVTPFNIGHNYEIPRVNKSITFKETDRNILDKNDNNYILSIIKKNEIDFIKSIPSPMPLTITKVTSQEIDEYYKQYLKQNNLNEPQENKVLDNNERREIYYIQYPNNIVLRLIKLYDYTNKLYVRLDYDAYFFDETIHPITIKEFALDYELEIKKHLINRIKRDIDIELDHIDKYDYQGYERMLNQLIQRPIIDKSRLYGAIQEYDVNIYHNEHPVYVQANHIAWLNTKDKYKYKRFVIDATKSQTTNEQESFYKTNINNKNQEIPKILEEYIDVDEDIISPFLSKDASRTQNIIDNLLKQAFDDPADRLEYKNQQEDLEYQKQLIKRLEYYANEIRNKRRSEAELKYISDFTYQKDGIDIRGEYFNFISENWYFVLTNIDKFEFVFLDWFLFPPKLNAKHNDEYLEKLKSTTKYKTFDLLNNYFDEMREADISAEHHSLTPTWYIVKNKYLHEIRIDNRSNTNKKNKLDLKPWVLYFQDTKNKVSVSVLTKIFHYSFGHGDQKYYDEFEKEFVDRYQNGPPAMMLLVWKDKR